MYRICATALCLLAGVAFTLAPVADNRVSDRQLAAMLGGMSGPYAGTCEYDDMVDGKPLHCGHCWQKVGSPEYSYTCAQDPTYPFGDSIPGGQGTCEEITELCMQCVRCPASVSGCGPDENCEEPGEWEPPAIERCRQVVPATEVEPGPGL